MRRAIYLFSALVLALPLAIGTSGASAAIGQELLFNPGLEAPNSTTGGPEYWTFSSWGTNMTAQSTYSADVASAHSGSHSVKVEISGTYTDGDAKWLPDPVKVTAGAYYSFSDWYESNRTSAVSVEYWTANQLTNGVPTGDGTWANLFSGISPASSWTQYQTGFTMPAGAEYATFAHFIAGIGWLQTDDYSMTQQDTPPGFGSPMVSLTFDDGSQGFYDRALPLVNQKGFKTTQYIPTGTFGSDAFMMTPVEVQEVAGQGHEIGSHSVTHPDLTTVSDTQLKDELVNSKTALEAIPGVAPVTDFAYPFGTYDARVIAAEQAAGYVSGRSVEEGYNSRLDLQPFDIRVQNMLPTTTIDQFKVWVDYAKTYGYWLVVVYHEIQPDGTPLCQNPNDDPKLPADPDPCVGPYDTTVGQFQQQLDYISTAGLGADVKTVRDALKSASTQMHTPSAGTVALAPTTPTTGTVLHATPSGFSDPDHGTLAYTYSWTLNGASVPGATDATGAAFTVPQVKRGDVIAVTVSARNTAGYMSSSVSRTITVGNSTPSAGSVAISPSSPTAPTALVATPAGFSDPDGDTLTYQYAWFENGQPIAGAAGSTLDASAVRPGTVSVQVRAQDGYGGVSDVVTAAVVVPAAAVVPAPPSVGPPSPVVDHTPPAIVVTVPRAGYYRIGSTLLVQYSCSDNSGVSSCTATLGPVGGAARSVTSGQKIRLSRAGRYVLSVSARDASGNAMTKTVNFRVTADRTRPSIRILSPAAASYRVGQMLIVKFTAADPIGVASTSATLGPVGGKASKVTSGGKVRLSTRGRYVLRITATDGVGNSRVKTLYLTVK